MEDEDKDWTFPLLDDEDDEDEGDAPISRAGRGRQQVLKARPETCEKSSPPMRLNPSAAVEVNSLCTLRFDQSHMHT